MEDNKNMTAEQMAAEEKAAQESTAQNAATAAQEAAASATTNDSETTATTEEATDSTTGTTTDATDATSSDDTNSADEKTDTSSDATSSADEKSDAESDTESAGSSGTTAGKSGMFGKFADKAKFGGKTKSGDKKKDDTLQKKVDELTDNLAKEKESYIRLMAEFETFRRRSAEERLSLINTASADTIKELLPVLDACESATKMLAQSSDEAAKEGTKLIFDKLLGALRKRGLKVMETNGEKFDADRHEAIAQIPAPTPELKGVILDTTRTGYELGGKIIRYPQVVVGA